MSQSFAELSKTSIRGWEELDRPAQSCGLNTESVLQSSVSVLICLLLAVLH